ncbi:hypothetical protein GS539_19380 [Rhodococcus hoagii]|nr:hypothetical protein [Prescottella equi]
MNQQDELAQDIRAVDGNHLLGASELAERLIERGWFRPRVVETESESGGLEALWTMPVGTSIECGSGMLWRKVATGMYGWAGTGVSHHCQPEVFMRDTPLTVLFLPEEKP